MLRENTLELLKRARAINPGVKIVAATKTRSAEEINELPSLGITAVGENRVQELLQKYDELRIPEIHFIGALQTNKVKYIVDKVSMIESVDRAELAAEIEKRCAAAGRVMDVLIEVNVGGEESKSGCAPGDLDGLASLIAGMKHLRIRGLMSVLPVDADESLYLKMRDLFTELKKKYDTAEFLSMGMSDDYETALKCGANLIRPGTALFGKRNYPGV